LPAMSHRAGTGDAPIPGLVTSRRNPAYKQRLQKQKEAEAAAEAARRAEIAKLKAAKQLQRSRQQRRSPSIRSEERERREGSEERRLREKKEADAKAQKVVKDAEEKRRKEAEEAEARKRWAEQEAKWAEERRLREEQKRAEEERKAESQKSLSPRLRRGPRRSAARQVARQQKLKGARASEAQCQVAIRSPKNACGAWQAFAMADEDDDEETPFYGALCWRLFGRLSSLQDHRNRKLAEKQKTRSSQASTWPEHSVGLGRSVPKLAENSGRILTAEATRNDF
ncbi:unnamed protein product, partial [Symbiodinium sp. CCMP2592]